MAILKIPGKDLDLLTAPPGLEPLEEDDLELIQAVDVSRTRGTADQHIELKIGAGDHEDDIVDALFHDGMEWIGSSHDFLELFSEEELPKKRGANDVIILPSGITDGQNRGMRSFFKSINVFRRKKGVAQLAGREIAKWIDKKLAPAPGLKRLSPAFTMTPFQEEVGASKNYFIFIHGTISNTEGSFQKLKEFDTTGAWPAIFDRYQDNVLALEHETVSQSPLYNAREALKAMPNDARINLMSGSRGGMVGDILARCDQRNEQQGFEKMEIQSVRDWDASEADIMVAINKLAREKNIEVHQNIRVACPAGGTDIIGTRADHFLNGLLGAIGLLVGSRANPAYQLVRRFITKVVRSRMTTGVMPGLLAMVPGSKYVQLFNNPEVSSSDNLFIIEGRASFGKIRHSILVVLTRLYFRGDNDFVVNTASMRLGVRRRNGFYWLRTKDGQTHHLNYFKNPPSQEAIKELLVAKDGAIPAKFRHSGTASTRGVVLKMFNLKKEDNQEISGKKPIVILLPGIMGSHLHAKGEDVWIDFNSIYKGKIKTHLAIEETSVKAPSIVGNYYSELVTSLKSKYDVYCFPFDWRKSVTQAAKLLKDVLIDLQKKGQPIKFLAHSMGGVVVRTLITQHNDIWKNYIQQNGSRFIMLGTPWYGSYLIMEVLTGKSSRVNQLAFLDFKNSKKALLNIFRKYPGVYELLPIESKRKFEELDFWKNLKKEFPDDELIGVPSVAMLNTFKAIKTAVNSHDFDFDKIIYVAGKSDWTTSDYRSKKTLFSKKLQFLKIAKGDGSVTWEGGIPKKLPNKNLYHTLTEHGQLANDPALFAGILDLLELGRTGKFSKNPPLVRGNRVMVSRDMNSLISNDKEEILHDLFGNVNTIIPESDQVAIDVTVVHADLRYSKYPVLVGHFKDDGIVSAESALNWHLDNKLKDRNEIGKYPGDISDSEIIIMPGNQPAGAIVVGLGDNTELTGFRLSKTVELGVISYAMFLRDNFDKEEVYELRRGISSLFIGSGYARLPLENALQAILNGVDRANKIIKSVGVNLEPISKLEFVELYEHKARNAYYSLKRIAKNESSLNINVANEIEQRNGAQKRLQYAHDEIWWDNLSTEYKVVNRNGRKQGQLHYNYSSGIARVESANNFTSQAVISTLLKDFSPNAEWKEKRAKTLFEILIPNNFKDIIRNQRNILWKMDETTAAYPWEMFHDYTVDAEPTFVNTGLIRQLVTENFRDNPGVVRSSTALVIGDPIYTDMPDFGQLPGALAEANHVDKILNQNDFTVDLYARSEGSTILDALYNTKYKLLHISGHGVFDPENQAVGAVLGSNIYLGPDLIQSLPYLPEFAFINCCHSGEVDGGHEKIYQDRYKLAANIGTALIREGVHAVVVAGWEVDDLAAEVFANTLYDRLLHGYNFGESVRMARKECYLQFPNSSTWGAYQCYGNQWYKLVKKGKPSGNGKSYIASEEVEVDLYNLYIKTEGRRKLAQPNILKKLDDIMQRAYDFNVINGRILEMEANILAGMEKLDEALEKYENLLGLNKADFSVRSLEQYCNLQVKVQTQKKKIKISEVNALLKDLRAIIMIGRTPERLSIMASAYKKFAIAVSDKKDEYLVDMFDSYHMAYEFTAPQSVEQLNALCNVLTAYLLIDDAKSKTLNGQSIHPTALLTTASTELRAGIGIASEFEQTKAKLTLTRCQLLFEKDSTNAIELGAQLIELYRTAWALGGNYNFLATEIQELDFLLAIDKRRVRKSVRNELSVAKTMLENWAEGKD